MKIGGLVLGKGIESIVRDGRTLNAMEKAGHFRRPRYDQPYVDNEFDGKKQPYKFTWHGNEYQIRFFSGCSFPFVVKLTQIKGESQ